MLTSFLQLTTSGIAIGMIYALMAVGLVLLVRAVGTMNFAQGDLLTFGAYITYWLAMELRFSTLNTILAAVLIFFLFGILFMFTVYWPVRNSSWPQAVIICTIGASTIIKNSMTIIWGSRTLSLDPILTDSLKIFDVFIEKQYFIVIIIAILIIAGIFLLFDKLYCGTIMQAAAQDKFAATLIGIPTTITTAATFIIVISIVGIGGYLVAPIFVVSTTLGRLQLRAFAGVVIGGFGNLKGAIISSVVIGLIEAYSTYITTIYKDAVVFIVLILVLVFRPSGLFGDRILDKA
jgi:branched-chain amino acid transport system permease protein